MTDPTMPDNSGNPGQQPPYQPPQYGPPQQYPPQPIYGQPQQPYVGQPQQYGQPFMPMAPAKKSHTGLILGIIGGVVAVILICIVGAVAIIGGGAASVQKQQTAANGDVRITNCTTQEMLSSTAGEATVSITNSGSGSADYFITVAFDSANGGQQYDTAIASVNDLAPGQTATADAAGFEAVGSDLTCKIVSVNRI